MGTHADFMVNTGSRVFQHDADKEKAEQSHQKWTNEKKKWKVLKYTVLKAHNRIRILYMGDKWQPSSQQ